MTRNFPVLTSILLWCVLWGGYTVISSSLSPALAFLGGFALAAISLSVLFTAFLVVLMVWEMRREY